MTALIAILLSTLSFAAERSFPVDSIKLADGKTAFCAAESDLGVVGYQPILPVVLGEERTAQISLSVFGVICSHDNGRFEWKLRPINDPFFTRSLDGELVENVILKNEAVVMNEANNKIFGSQELANQTMQMVSIRLELQDILSSAQRRDLDNGQAVSVRVLYFHRATNNYVYRGKRHSGRAFVGGAYSFAFTLERDGGRIKATSITVF